MAKIAVDAMSGDRGYEISVAAIKQVVSSDPTLEIIAVGQKAVLEPLLQGTQRVSIHDAAEIITMEDKPLASLRKRKSSMFQTVSLVKEGQAQAAVSAGNTGALMGISRILLKMMKGFSRPALAGFVPCQMCNDSFCILDLGANVDRSADMLVSFAYLGDALYRAVRGVDRPSVGLLNIGEEHLKGGDELREALERLEASDLNFIGNVEANNLYSKAADVVVSDGFTGNVFLKTMEGLSGMIRGMLINAYTKNPYSKFAGVVSKPVLDSLKTTMDSRRYNGATVLGLNGLVIKSHGNADDVSFRSALELAVKQVDNGLIDMVAECTYKL